MLSEAVVVTKCSTPVVSWSISIGKVCQCSTKGMNENPQSCVARIRCPSPLPAWGRWPDPNGPYQSVLSFLGMVGAIDGRVLAMHHKSPRLLLRWSLQSFTLEVSAKQFLISDVQEGCYCRGRCHICLQNQLGDPT